MFAISAVAPLAEEVLDSFTGSADGGVPFGNLVRDAAGNLYGTTSLGGVENGGTVFQVTLQGGLTQFATFAGGALPYSGLFLDSAANPYGTTFSGGSSHRGTVFQIP